MLLASAWNEFHERDRGGNDGPALQPQCTVELRPQISDIGSCSHLNHIGLCRQFAEIRRSGGSYLIGDGGSLLGLHAGRFQFAGGSQCVERFGGHALGCCEWQDIILPRLSNSLQN